MSLRGSRLHREEMARGQRERILGFTRGKGNLHLRLEQLPWFAAWRRCLVRGEETASQAKRFGIATLTARY